MVNTSAVHLGMERNNEMELCVLKIDEKSLRTPVGIINVFCKMSLYEVIDPTHR